MVQRPSPQTFDTSTITLNIGPGYAVLKDHSSGYKRPRGGHGLHYGFRLKSPAGAQTARTGKRFPEAKMATIAALTV
jgi:hypothetical protein